MPALYVNLMPKYQDLGYQRSSRPEQPDQRRPNKAARFPHRTEALRDSASAVSPIRFTTGTGSRLVSRGSLKRMAASPPLPSLRNGADSVSCRGATCSITALGSISNAWCCPAKLTGHCKLVACGPTSVRRSACDSLDSRTRNTSINSSICSTPLSGGLA